MRAEPIISSKAPHVEERAAPAPLRRIGFRGSLTAAKLAVICEIELAVLFGYLADLRLGRRLLIALLSIPIAIIANGVRVAGTGIAAHYVGAAAASGFLHAFSGVVVFAASFAMLMGLAGIMRAIDPPAAIGRPEPAL